jgi:RNA polymerase sigma factor (sigma-70 family)
MVRTMSASSDTSTPDASKGVFVTTRWSVVLTAGRNDTSRAQEALEQLCQIYWRPLYAYLRRRGYAHSDAEDLTQAFFARLLERKDVATVHPDRGKFRSYLLAALNHFLSDEWDKARAQKRGGGQVITLDMATIEAEEQQADTLSPEKVFDRRWALTVLEGVHRRLRQEHEQEGRGAQFEALRFCLMGERSSLPYAELAGTLGLSEGAVKVAVHRLRQRYRRLLRELIAETVAGPDEVEEELRYLLRALAGQ